MKGILTTLITPICFYIFLFTFDTIQDSFSVKLAATTYNIRHKATGYYIPLPRTYRDQRDITRNGLFNSWRHDEWKIPYVLYHRENFARDSRERSYRVTFVNLSSSPYKLFVKKVPGRVSTSQWSVTKNFARYVVLHIASVNKVRR